MKDCRQRGSFSSPTISFACAQRPKGTADVIDDTHVQDDAARNITTPANDAEEVRFRSTGEDRGSYSQPFSQFVV